MAHLVSFQADTDETVQLPVGGGLIRYTLRPLLYCLNAAILISKSFSLPSSLIFISHCSCRIDSYYFFISPRSRLSHFCHRPLNFFNMSLSQLKADSNLSVRRNRNQPDANKSDQPSLGHVIYADTSADLHSSSSNTDKTDIDRCKQPAAGEVSPSQSANPGPHYTLSSTLIHSSGLHR